MPKVLTHKGFKSFDGVLVSSNNEKKILLKFKSNKILKCTFDHKLLDIHGQFIFAKDLSVGEILFGNEIISDIKHFNSDELVYDLLNVSDVNSYYTNNIISHNCVFCDEFAHIHRNLAEEFFTSTYPVISSGKDTKLIIVSTPKGMNLYYQLWMDAISGKSDYKPLDIHWSEVPGRDEEWKAEQIRNSSEKKFAQEYCCEFLGSTNTLIDGAKLQQLYAKDYIDEIHGMEIFEFPVKEYYDDETQKMADKDHVYVLCADVSEGKNLDYSAFTVFDCSTIPYKQVAIYRNNTISPLLFPDVLKMCAEYYNNAYVLIEINNNPQVADCLYQDLEYENVFQIYSGNKHKQQLSESGKATQNGLNMSPLVKRTGCSTLKTLIETNKLEIYSSDTIYELSTFIVNKGSFAAEDGSNDDLVMNLVMFGWLTTQKLFIEISSSDIRKRLQIEHNYAKNDEDIADAPPNPVFENPFMDKYTLEDGDLWEIVEPVNYYNF